MKTQFTRLLCPSAFLMHPSGGRGVCYANSDIHETCYLKKRASFDEFEVCSADF
jgi:hypothetical protein